MAGEYRLTIPGRPVPAHWREIAEQYGSTYDAVRNAVHLMIAQRNYRHLLPLLGYHRERYSRESA